MGERLGWGCFPVSPEAQLSPLGCPFRPARGGISAPDFLEGNLLGSTHMLTHKRLDSAKPKRIPSRQKCKPKCTENKQACYSIF